MTHTILASAYICILCDEVYAGEPAEQARNGPVCRRCVAESKRLAVRMKRGKKRKKRRKR